MPIPEFVADLRARVGNDLLWLTGVSAIVLAELDGADHVLLGRRADNGYWSGIYGILEPGEQPAVAAAREVHEETGIRTEIIGLASVVSDPKPARYPNGDRAQYLDLTFLARPVPGAHDDLRAAARVGDDESTDVGWFALDALPEPLAFRADPAAGPYLVRP